MVQTQVKLALFATVGLIVWMVNCPAWTAESSASQGSVTEDPGKAASPEVSRAIAV
jgi:hypothetical protein